MNEYEYDPAYLAAEKGEHELTKIKLEELHKAFSELQQSYHTLCQIVNADRHTSKSWKDCDEMTCSGARKLLKDIGVE